MKQTLYILLFVLCFTANVYGQGQMSQNISVKITSEPTTLDSEFDYTLKWKVKGKDNIEHQWIILTPDQNFIDPHFQIGSVSKKERTFNIPTDLLRNIGISKMYVGIFIVDKKFNYTYSIIPIITKPLISKIHSYQTGVIDKLFIVGEGFTRRNFLTGEEFLNPKIFIEDLKQNIIFEFTGKQIVLIDNDLIVLDISDHQNIPVGPDKNIVIEIEGVKSSGRFIF